MKKIFVKPAKGVKVRHPYTRKHIKEEGEPVEKNHYWIRRIEEGDVKMVDMKKGVEAPGLIISKSQKKQKDEVKA